MTRHLHFNCFSGAGGDMILAALVDLGADAELLDRTFRDLDIGVKALRFTDVMRGGMRGRLLRIEQSGNGHSHAEGHSHHHHHDHPDHEPHVHKPHSRSEHNHHHSHDHGPHRHLKDMLDIVDRSGAAPEAGQRAARALRLLAEAEGRIHGASPESVHFHEISGIDTIVDVLGSCIALHMLDVGSVSASPVTVGRGSVRCAHGTFTVPAPATLEILSASSIPCEPGDRDGEFLTPTGAALLAAMADHFGPAPAMRPERTGYGAGVNDYPGHANLLQATLGAKA